ncbi:Transcriptional regulator TetR family [Patulibacter medicamentivorans]|uniref:Transcriptional regulator TetR family n=1 Tax=Patulibacter medicamentivorans TaxID=1097667 RepID=H0EB24_9ACTN|nr:TetR/AcrR family transcriptional regulator [Patulibacter medicamentivorans]EHN09099.1 Transcriptional regulator TetR family [Patulibacter medicamentivorans]
MPIEQRREQLLDAAIQVIARDGYGRLSIDAIAREADVTRPVVYGAFDGLEPLLYALLERQERRALEQVTGVLPLDLDLQDPDAFVAATVRRLVEIVGGDPLTWRPILLAPEGTPTPVRERIARDREVVRERIAVLLEAGLALRGGPDLDAEIVSHALMAILEHFGRLIVEDPDRFEVERLVATVQAVLGSLRP